MRKDKIEKERQDKREERSEKIEEKRHDGREKTKYKRRDNRRVAFSGGRQESSKEAGKSQTKRREQSRTE